MISNYKVKVNDSCNYKVSITDIQNKYKFKLFCAGADLTDYYTKEQVDQSQNTQDILIDNILNQIPTGTATGETINITDSSSLPLKDIQVAGNTYQETTTGKNLFNSDTIIPASIGSKTNATYDSATRTLTLTNNSSDTFLPTLYGNAPYINGINITVKANTTYTLSFNVDQPVSTLKIGVYGVQANNTYTLCSGWYQTTSFSFNTNEFTQIAIRIGTTSASGVVTKFSDFQLEESPSATPFEPYTNGASPNPDYPQTITNVTGTNTIKIVGKNLLNYDNNTNYENKFINSNGEWQNDNEAYINEKIVLNSKVISIYVGSKTGNANIRLGQFKNDGTFISRTLINSTTNNITLDNECSYVWLSINKGSNLYFTNLSVVYGSSNTNYEAYKEKSYTINLGSIELCKIGDYKDRIYYSSGKWYLEKNIGKIVLNGSDESNWNYSNTCLQSKNEYPTGVISPDASRLGLSTRFICKYYATGITTSLNNGEFGWNSGKCLTFKIDNMSSKQDYLTWLSNNNTIIYYILATPTTEEITDATLVGQLDALLNSTTYKTTTNITVDTTNQKPTLTLTYRKDLETLIGG